MGWTREKTRNLWLKCFQLVIFLESSYSLPMTRKSQSYFGSAEFQSKMLMIFSGISLVQGAFFAFAAHSFMGSVKSVAMKAGIEESHAFFEKLRLEETFFYLLIMGSILVATLLFVYLGLKVTHEAVGAICASETLLMYEMSPNASTLSVIPKRGVIL